ncbi:MULTISPECIES: hypothetical protein [Methylobacterium]|jgi:hypothetical protein|uniref:Uncharacterized protein n=2 Tax=Methylobacterium TaxID=407 RepID=A0A0C6FQ35_9HYPH|nr:MULTISPECIES: hypothetical protein [Methylobacterium]MBK3398238.1 hypothetical protein [Methylobacterium ajmalii]MBK3407426.1 hypothetical protein [Methylobacterium ajmalii]MBK3423482.1 hypothetical protein [Methylobacterium ajmalii]MBZ6411931.1 hypothetical protein [Methylobacterium sp.]SEP49412.1 hypothetical protein SAMN04487843_13063 [Methylobacterium sp. ap11]
MTAPLTFEDDVEARLGALELIVAALLRERIARDPDAREAVLEEVRREARVPVPPTPKTEAALAKALALAEIILAP